MRLVDADSLVQRFSNFKQECISNGDVVAAGIFDDVIAEIQSAQTIITEQDIDSIIDDSSRSLYTSPGEALTKVIEMRAAWNVNDH